MIKRKIAPNNLLDAIKIILYYAVFLKSFIALFT